MWHQLVNEGENHMWHQTGLSSNEAKGISQVDEKDKKKKKTEFAYNVSFIISRFDNVCC